MVAPHSTVHTDSGVTGLDFYSSSEHSGCKATIDILATGNMFFLHGEGRGQRLKHTSPCLVGEVPPTLHTEYLQAVVVANGDPVRLSGGPLHIVDLSLSCVGQDRVLNGPRHLLDVPDEGLMVIRWEKASKNVIAPAMG